MALEPDCDTGPEHLRPAGRVTGTYLIGTRSPHEHIASKLLAAGVSRVLDIGGGEGALAGALPHPPPLRLVGLDVSGARLRAHPPPRVRADARRLPFRDAAFDAAVAVDLLGRLDDPVRALREARRVLAPGGLLLVTAVCRTDSPELRPVWRPEPTAFDAEEAPELVCEVFGEVEVERWDAPLLTLPDRNAVRDYLTARRVPRPAAAAAAAALPTPLPVTKRGCLLLARR